MISQTGDALKLNLANILTLLRIAAIPVVVVCFYSPLDYARPIAAILFGLAAITDMIDGWVARRFGQMSRFGEFLDPVADKLMVAIVLVMLVQAQSSWFEDVIAMIIIGREITISALREWMAEIGDRTKVAVSAIGKFKTTVLLSPINRRIQVYKYDATDFGAMTAALRDLAGLNDAGFAIDGFSADRLLRRDLPDLPREGAPLCGSRGGCDREQGRTNDLVGYQF